MILVVIFFDFIDEYVFLDYFIYIVFWPWKTIKPYSCLPLGSVK